jgi:hypothetical protein
MPLQPKRIVSMRQGWLPVVLDFCANLTIDSKESGVGPLHLYRAQRRFLEEVCDGLDRGVRHFLVLKARQLGISTISLALDLLWLSVHPGTQGALITDDDGNREKFRVLLERYINSLPRGLRVGIKAHNRHGLVLNNGSSLDYLVAGKKRGNITLGQSRALSFVHGTEIGSWGSEEGVASLLSSLAERNPNRFYIFESTAHGFNLWFNMWQSAAKDRLRKKRIFIGWWSMDLYELPEDSKGFRQYWTGDLDDYEEELVAKVKAEFNVEITPAQIAWHRMKRTEDIHDDDLMNQNFPWTPEMAFITSGHSFFPGKKLAEDIRFLADAECPMQAFGYQMGENFLATELVPLSSARDADLRVWEEPSPFGVYVMGADPAYGRSDDAANHCIVVYRCYADRLVQVAEYASGMPDTYQCAWVMSHLAGAYKNVWINLEVTGPGFAVMQELRHLKRLLDDGYLRNAASQAGLEDVFASVKWYLYHRPDQLGAGYVYGWKSNLENKMTIMNQLRDAYTLRMVTVRSIPLLKEMERVTQKGSDISAEGTANDDRVVASALACKAWTDWVRNPLISTGQTYDVVSADERQEGPQQNFMGNLVRDFFKRQEDKRRDEEDAEAWKGIEI